MSVETFFQSVRDVTAQFFEVSNPMDLTLNEVGEVIVTTAQTVDPGTSPFVIGLTVFILACFVGYYVVWRVTPALHSPLMAVTNAISSVIIVGALLTGGVGASSGAKILGAFAVFLAAVNIFGGFAVTSRMLRMFEKKK